MEQIGSSSKNLFFSRFDLVRPNLQWIYHLKRSIRTSSYLTSRSTQKRSYEKCALHQWPLKEFINQVLEFKQPQTWHLIKNNYRTCIEMDAISDAIVLILINIVLIPDLIIPHVLKHVQNDIVGSSHSWVSREKRDPPKLFTAWFCKAIYLQFTQQWSLYLVRSRSIFFLVNGFPSLLLVTQYIGRLDSIIIYNH